MPYSKPQVTILGDAESLVALTGFKPLVYLEDGFMLFRVTLPAYDLDE